MTAQPTLPAVEPKPRRRLRQPTKCVLRDQLVLAADSHLRERALILECVVGLRSVIDTETERDALQAENTELRAELDAVPAWLRRLFRFRR